MCSSDPTSLHSAIAALDSALTALAADQPDDADVDIEIAAYAIELRVQRLRAQAIRRLGLLAEVDGEEVTAARLGRRTRCGRAAAVAQVRVGLRLRALPVLAAAVADGRVGFDQARAVCAAATDERLPRVQRDQAELVAAAARMTPAGIRGHLDDWRHRVDPDGVADDETTTWRRRHADFTTTDDDGSAELTARWGIEQAAVVRTAIRAAYDAGWIPGDTRSTSQRTADAIVEICDHYNRHAYTPQRGGRPRQVIIVTRRQPAPAGARTGAHTGPRAGAHAAPDAGCANVADEGPLSAVGVEQALCDAEIVDCELGDDGEVLHWGRARRYATPAQKAALAVRDGGCVADGCRFADRPDRTDAHHIAWWDRDHGPTDLDNLVLLCGHHHTSAHRDRWHIHRDPADGRRTLRPPPRRHPTPRTDAAAQLLPDWYFDPVVPGVLSDFGLPDPIQVMLIPQAPGEIELTDPPSRHPDEHHPLDDLPHDPFDTPQAPPASLPPPLVRLVALEDLTPPAAP